MDTGHKIEHLLIGVVITALVIGSFWYWYSQKTSVFAPEEQGGLGAQIFENVENPIKEELPETNPFSADTNPFDVPANPLENEYKNPFQ